MTISAPAAADGAVLSRSGLGFRFAPADRSPAAADGAVLSRSGLGFRFAPADRSAEDFDQQDPSIRRGDGDRQDEREWQPVQPAAALRDERGSGHGVADDKQ
jgi:hypothetical protein